jgi:cyanuric acid amidohydrolase
MAVDVLRFEMDGPDDTRGLTTALKRLGDATIPRLALLAKVEGTATLNDFSRALALRAITDALGEFDIERQQVVISTGCEGVATPGGFLIVDRPDDETRFSALAFGFGSSGAVSAKDLIGPGHIAAAAEATRLALDDAGLSAADAGLVLMKSPVLTRAAAHGQAAHRLARANSTALSRGVAALGIGVALGDIAETDATDDAIAGRPDLYCERAMVFSGTETQACEAIVFGNVGASQRALIAGSIADIIDHEGLFALAGAERARIAAAFFKAGAAPPGLVRGARTTMFSSEVDSDKHLRAAASGLLGGFLGHTRSFISGGAEHQAAPGRCLFAAILEDRTPA